MTRCCVPDYTHEQAKQGFPMRLGCRALKSLLGFEKYNVNKS